MEAKATHVRLQDPELLKALRAQAKVEDRFHPVHRHGGRPRIPEGPRLRMTATDAASAIRRIILEACERDPDYAALVAKVLGEK